jgi:ribonuclease HI
MLYDIIRSIDSKILITVEGWPNAQAALKQFPGTYPKKVSASVEKLSPTPISGENLAIYVDGWSKGNPGAGGYQIFHNGSIVVRKELPNTTNNYCELCAIGAGYRYLLNNPDTKIIYSDSKIAIGWVKNGINPASKMKEEYKNELNKLINAIRRFPNWETVELLYSPGASNPADPGHKK